MARPAVLPLLTGCPCLRGTDWYLFSPIPPPAQVEVPANTALVVCREKGGILNILLAPLGEQGSHAR